MDDFIKGIDLCEGFFNEMAKPIIDKNFPGLKYSAGLIGYGSDVLGYDDAVSADHMWGPRFYMFLDKSDIGESDKIFETFCENLPYTYKGYSVNFTEPNENDNGVQKPSFITSGKVNPLIFIRTFEDFLSEQLGTADPDNITSYQWLSFSEHRLLSLVSGKLFTDGLGLSETISKIKYYPHDVKLYLIASCWDIIASEQAFVRRSGDVGDDIGSRMICARIAERLMRLCFLYKDTYAPYSKWFGTAFSRLDIDGKIRQAIASALSADSLTEREDSLVTAQALVADMHNESGLTDHVDCRIESYLGRDIKVIFADKLSGAAVRKLKGTAFENVPLIGSMSQIGGLSEFSDNADYYKKISELYR
ncbi:MAG: DUF4037 domain-containing protein [Oscillospiraceae bacterium]|nr:DUF4037 domain-containing protein [Oscillospiraceae bacterium]